MKSIFKENKKFLLITVVVSVLCSMLVMIIPLYINLVFNESGEYKVGDVLIIILIMLVSSALQILLVLLREKYAAKFNVDNSNRLYEKMFSMTYDKLLENEPTYLVERISMMVNSLYDFIASKFSNIASSVIITIASIAVVFTVNPFIGLMLFLVIPVNYFGYQKLNKKLAKKCEIMQEDTASGYKEIISLCKNIDFVKQFSEPNILIDRISPALTRIFDSMAHVNIYAQSMSTVIGLFNGFVQNATLILLCLQVLYFNDGVFNLVIISIILPLYFEAVRGFVSTNLSVSNLKTNAAFIKENIESNIEHDGTKVIDTVRSIQINNPSFMIGGESKHFDVKEEFTIGDVVNVKGASGVGKSTFVKLLLSFRESEGILINNINISEISKRSLRSKITYLPQDSAILPTTIRDNISIDADISIDWESLKESPILKPVLNNKSINDIILENGTNLSGGERQRIALCRALQQDSDVFILDEIASNLDKIAAEKIYEDIMTQINDKIVFIISHDPDLSVKYNKEVVAKIV